MRDGFKNWFVSFFAPHRRIGPAVARAAWERDRAELRDRFLSLARASGKPEGLHWAGCEWTDTVRFARDRGTGLLAAFAGVVVRFEAVAGGGMEEVEAVSLPRDATAVFHYDGLWGTGGRALFNMTPDEAVARMDDQFEAVDGTA